MKLHQIAAGFQMGDAISQEMIAIQTLLKERGIDGSIYAENIGHDPKKLASKWIKCNPGKDDIVVYHHSISSDAFGFLRGLPCKRFFVYHNVTPFHYFEPYDLKFAYLLKQGRQEIKNHLDLFQRFFAVSQFNQKELLQMGVLAPSLFPLHLNFKDWNVPKVTPTSESNEKTQFLFVGRIAPNKKQTDIIRFAKIWIDLYGDNFLFHLIGFNNPSLNSYYEEISYMIRFFNLQNNIKITPYVTESDLATEYKKSSAFLSMSEHEGFCVPLLEAMHFQIPVLAYAGGAVEETLGGAGVLFREKDFVTIAKLLKVVLENKELQEKILQGQKKRLSNYFSELDNFHPAKIFLNE